MNTQCYSVFIDNIGLWWTGVCFTSRFLFVRKIKTICLPADCENFKYFHLHNIENSLSELVYFSSSIYEEWLVGIVLKRIHNLC